MRRLLYGTTALVGAGMVAAGPAAAQNGPEWNVSVNGYMNEFFGFGDVDDDNPGGVGERNLNGTGHFDDGEIHFNFAITLDNGVDVGGQVQLEAFTSGDQIDENYLFVSGSFGRLVLGSENAAAYLMHPGAPNVGVPINSGWITSFVDDQAVHTTGFRHPALSTFIDWGNDENRATYFTPRIAGFQLGASYTPCVTGTGTGANFPAVCTDGNGAGGVAEGTDQVSVGANFARDFNGISVSIGGGWSSILDENEAVFPDGSPDQYQGGVSISYAGFSVGGSFAYQDSEDNGVATAQTVNDGHSFDAGASYSTGPWSVGVTYLGSESAGGVGNGEDELDAVEGGVEYALGPGVSTSASVLYANWEDEAGAETDGIVGVLGLSVSF